MVSFVNQRGNPSSELLVEIPKQDILAISSSLPGPMVNFFTSINYCISEQGLILPSVDQEYPFIYSHGRILSEEFVTKSKSGSDPEFKKDRGFYTYAPADITKPIMSRRFFEEWALDENKQVLDIDLRDPNQVVLATIKRLTELNK
jgi:hypothetical protein